MSDTRTEPEILKACGGKMIVRGGESVWDFGYRPSRPEDTAFVLPHDPFEDVPEIQGDKVFLWEYPRMCNGGKHPPYSYQLTGSCVNSGGQNAAIVRVGVECVNLTQPEAFKLPFTLHAYGYSRHLIGDEGQGEGSSGDAMARALEAVGVTTLDDQNAPKPRMFENAFCFTEQTELQFSSWRNCPQAIKDAAKPHPFKYIAVTTADEAEKELRRGRPLTWAGDWGGKMKASYKGAGANRILWNGGRSSTWNHQECIFGLWRHPEFGGVWYLQNNWYMIQGNVAVPVHGEPANGEPPGGNWIGDPDMDYQLRGGEVRGIKDFSGFVNGLIHFGNV